MCKKSDFSLFSILTAILKDEPAQSSQFNSGDVWFIDRGRVEDEVMKVWLLWTDRGCGIYVHLDIFVDMCVQCVYYIPF